MQSKPQQEYRSSSGMCVEMDRWMDRFVFVYIKRFFIKIKVWSDKIRYDTLATESFWGLCELSFIAECGLMWKKFYKCFSS